MSDKRNHRNSCVQIPAESIYDLTSGMMADLTSGKEKMMQKYPVYLCFSNSCFGEEDTEFQLTTLHGIGSVVKPEYVKEIDFTYVVDRLSLFYIFLIRNLHISIYIYECTEEIDLALLIL